MIEVTVGTPKTTEKFVLEAPVPWALVMLMGALPAAEGAGMAVRLVPSVSV